MIRAFEQQAVCKSREYDFGYVVFARDEQELTCIVAFFMRNDEYFPEREIQCGWVLGHYSEEKNSMTIKKEVNGWNTYEKRYITKIVNTNHNRSNATVFLSRD